MKNPPKPTKPPVFEHMQAHKGVTGSEGWKEQRSRKENNGFIWFECEFWQRCHANALLQIKIPVVLCYSVPRGGWESNFTGLRGRVQIWSPWQLEPPTLAPCVYPAMAPDVILRGNRAGGGRIAHPAKANTAGWDHNKLTCAYTIYFSPLLLHVPRSNENNSLQHFYTIRYY